MAESTNDFDNQARPQSELSIGRGADARVDGEQQPGSSTVRITEPWLRSRHWPTRQRAGLRIIGLLIIGGRPVVTPSPTALNSHANSV